MDPVGTVRREEHEGGYSVWVLVADWKESPKWQCIESTAGGNCGFRIPIDDDGFAVSAPVVGLFRGRRRRWHLMAELSLPERLVHAAETGIREAAIDVATFPLGDKAYGYVADFAKMAGPAMLRALADYYGEETVRCTLPPKSCSRCIRIGARVDELRSLADRIFYVPAQEGT